MRLKSLAGRISVHGNLEDDKILYRGLSARAARGNHSLLLHRGGGPERAGQYAAVEGYLRS